jgi:tRNA nucleotidyltransferase/poly(A) polymerase
MKSGRSKNALLREYIQSLIEQSSGSQPVKMKMDMSLPEDMMKIAAEFRRAGKKLYVVGGAIRDTILGKEPKDYDLATDALPDEVIAIVSRPERKVDLTGKAFGVVRVFTPEKNEYEIATFRRDLTAGRRPDQVEFTNIETDVKRRDLTVNALFYDLETSEVVDYVGGIADLENKVVRAVGNPFDRFAEDKLRVLRAIRFAARLGSQLDSQTKSAILADTSLDQVSPDRIHDEFSKGIGQSQKPSLFISLLHDTRMFPQIFPGLNVAVGPLSDSKSVAVQTAILLRRNKAPAAEKTLRAQKFSGAEVQEVSFLLQLQDINTENVVRLKKEMNRFRIDHDDLKQFATVSRMPEKTVDAFLKFASQPPAANVNDLMSQGITGPKLGAAVAQAEKDAFISMMNEIVSIKRKIRSVVQKTLNEDFNMGESDTIVYTSFELDNESREKLLKLAPAGWKKLADHMTIIAPGQGGQRLPSRWLDFSGPLSITAIAKNEKIMTALVDDGDLLVPFKGPSFPHITIATNGVNPVESNKFRASDFVDLPSPIYVTGHVKEKQPRKLSQTSQLFCDMDGVLVDFEAGAVQRINQVLSNLDSHPLANDRYVVRAVNRIHQELGPDFRVTSDADLRDPAVKKLSFSLIKEDPGAWFFSLNPLVDGVNKLWPFLNSLGIEVNILTAGVRGGKHGSQTSEAGKFQWVKKHLTPQPIRFFESPAANEKQRWATMQDGSANILIDDKESTINEWNNAGGFGILHVPGRSDDSIAAVKKLLRR